MVNQCIKTASFINDNRRSKIKIHRAIYIYWGLLEYKYVRMVQDNNISYLRSVSRHIYD